MLLKSYGTLINYNFNLYIYECAAQTAALIQSMQEYKYIVNKFLLF